MYCILVKNSFWLRLRRDYRYRNDWDKLTDNFSKGAFTNDVSREGEGGGYPKSDAVREVA